MRERIWELDFVRGVAILGVIAYHTAYDLQNVFGVFLGYGWQWVFYFAAIFVVISGMCAQLSKNTLRRGLGLACVALLLTAVTYFYAPDSFIRFGILHLLAGCMILYPLFFSKMKSSMLWAISLVIILLGFYLNTIKIPARHLYMLGIIDSDFISMDYFPLLPWSGFFMIGVALSRVMYKEKKSIFSVAPKWAAPFEWCGRSSLMIYLVHQPLIMVILSVALSHPLW